MLKMSHLSNCHFDLINFLIRSVSIKGGGKDGLSLTDVASLIEPKLLNLAKQNLAHPDELLFCKSMVRSIKIPGVEILSEDPENIYSVYILIGMYIAAILDEKEAFPEVTSKPLGLSDVGLLKDELSAIKHEIRKSAEAQIEIIENDYNLLKEAIIMTIERKPEEEEDEDFNFC